MFILFLLHVGRYIYGVLGINVPTYGRGKLRARQRDISVCY